MKENLRVSRNSRTRRTKLADEGEGKEETEKAKWIRIWGLGKRNPRKKAQTATLKGKAKRNLRTETRARNSAAHTTDVATATRAEKQAAATSRELARIVHDSTDVIDLIPSLSNILFYSRRRAS